MMWTWKTEDCVQKTRFHAIDMGPEIPLRNAPQPFMENLIRNIPCRPIFVQPKHSNLPVVNIVHELKNYIDVYGYREVNHNPEFEKLQTISTLNDYRSPFSISTLKKVIVSDS